MAKKRSSIDIIADMLTSIEANGGKIKPTHLMYKSNLSHTQMKSYLEDLLKKELIAKVKKESYDYIIITDDGYRFFQKLKEMKEFERTFGL